MSRRNLDEFPELMTAKDLAEWRGLSLKRIYALDREGAFTFAENRPRIGTKSWSRDRLKQWVNGELVGLTGSKLRRVS